jgi:hypothetical protein
MNKSMAGTIPPNIRKLLAKRLGELAPFGPIRPQLLDEQDNQTNPVQPTNRRTAGQPLPDDRGPIDRGRENGPHPRNEV